MKKRKNVPPSCRASWTEGKSGCIGCKHYGHGVEERKLKLNIKAI